MKIGQGHKKLRVEKVCAFRAKYLFRGEKFPVEDFTYEEPSEGYATKEIAKHPSAYSRYHYLFYGKPYEVRTPDNRFDGTLKTPQELAR